MRAPRSASSRIVARPITPAAPVTTATLPSRRIRSGIDLFPPVVPVVPAFAATISPAERRDQQQPMPSFRGGRLRANPESRSVT
jgi:hypothetical protein